MIRPVVYGRVCLQAGLYEKWVADLLTETKLRSQRRQRNRQAEQRDENDAELESLTALTIIHAQGAFILFLLGLYIACVAFVGELIAKRLFCSHGAQWCDWGASWSTGERKTQSPVEVVYYLIFFSFF